MKRFQGMASWIKRSKAFTLLELLIVIAILAILAGFIMGAISGAKIKAQTAIAKSQIKSLTTALEAYNAEVGFYPRDKANTLGADLPHLLFAALNNKPTSALGGGPSAPYYDADRSGIGILNGVEPTEILDNDGLSTSRTGITAGEVDYFNCDDLAPNANPNSAAFQSIKPYASAPAKIKMDSTYAGFPAFVDPWRNAYHYREWASKSENRKQTESDKNKVDLAPHNFNTFDIWSNGHDNINQFGHPESDDVSNWGR